MTRQARHAMLPLQSHDEDAREAFLASMRQFIVTQLYQGNRTVYDSTVLPRFVREHGRAPANALEVKQAMADEDYYRLYGAINRGTQELLWDSVGESIERQLETLDSEAMRPPVRGGTLTLDPFLDIPSYATAVDIHVMPGGFGYELGENDVFAGALYDRGVHVYAYGGLGPTNAGVGEATLAFITEHFSDLKPRTILDAGCGVGHSTLPLCAAFPDAEVFGVDLAAPMLRYGHRRAEAMGHVVHFSQQDAARTNFPDASFDLVVTGLLLHEIPQKKSKEIIKECYRLLTPGGVMLHNDLTCWPEDPFDDFMATWNSHHNNEPFQRGSGELDWLAVCSDAGFEPANIIDGQTDAAFMKEELAIVGLRGAQK